MRSCIGPEPDSICARKSNLIVYRGNQYILAQPNRVWLRLLENRKVHVFVGWRLNAQPCKTLQNYTFTMQNHAQTSTTTLKLVLVTPMSWYTGMPVCYCVTLCMVCVCVTHGVCHNVCASAGVCVMVVSACIAVSECMVCHCVCHCQCQCVYSVCMNILCQAFLLSVSVSWLMYSDYHSLNIVQYITVKCYTFSTS